MRRSTALLLALMMAVWSSGNGQENKKEGPDVAQKAPSKKKTLKDSPPPKLELIEIRSSGPGRQPSPAYYMDDQKLESLSQLQAVIDPLKDREASRLLSDSESRSTLGKVLIVCGGSLCVGGVIYGITAASTTTTETGPYGTPYDVSTPSDSTPFWLLGGAGAGVILLGLIAEGDGEHNRQAAVERYNHLVQGDKDLSMLLLPVPGSPRLELTQRF